MSALRKGDQTTITDDGRITSFRFLDHEDALREFERIFADDPDLAGNVEADTLPTSFRLRVLRAADIEAIKSALERMPGVWRVVTPEASLVREVVPLSAVC